MTAQAHSWDASAYAKNAAFVPALGQPVLDLLAPRPGERILDLGCGDGVLTQRLVDAGADVLGVDTSAPMLAAARQRGLIVQEMDGQALTFDGEFDAILSNAALHWMPDQRAVYRGVFRALKPGGRFVAECGGQGNIAAMRTALRAVMEQRGLSVPETQTYPSADAATRQLEAAGFAVESAQLIPRPTPLPGGMAHWFRTFRHGFIPEGHQESIIAAAVALLRPALCDDEGRWTADYVRLRFKALKPKD
ncbi:MAG: methyltransferase domain-containing protein [Pacificimonas sp.]|jgi:SAM-dependent methyltransferase|nr:methyltransferase domain-containing protein [Pacificimonas sp.]